MTGLAISGFDPVVYFSEGKPKPGQLEFELGANGAVRTDFLADSARALMAAGRKWPALEGSIGR